MHIANREISTQHSPYIIAELSANHNGSIEKAKNLIKSAKENGADAVKIQTYTADSMTIDSHKDDFLIKEGLWNGYTLYELYEEAYTPISWHKELFNYAKELEITLFSTPFDENAVDLLEELQTPAYKISSFEICDIPLIKYIASKKKPILMSTGMATLEEISEAISAAKSERCYEILLFHCISSYPTPISESNLRNILKLKSLFDVEIGLSDHTLGTIAASTAVALGATAIEKHFTLSREDKGPDSEFSIEPKELKDLVNSSKNSWEALGREDFSRSQFEKKNRDYRRSIYFVKDLKANEIIKRNDIRRIRPGNGLSPKYFEEIIGKKTSINVERGDPVTWDKIK